MTNEIQKHVLIFTTALQRLSCMYQVSGDLCEIYYGIDRALDATTNFKLVYRNRKYARGITFWVENRPHPVLKDMTDYDWTLHDTCYRFETVFMTIFKIRDKFSKWHNNRSFKKDQTVYCNLGLIHQTDQVLTEI